MWSSPLAEQLPVEHPFGVALLTVHTVFATPPESDATSRRWGQTAR